MNDNARIIYGFLSQAAPKHQDDRYQRGYISTVFEEIDSRICPINGDKLYDHSERTFLLEGYQDILDRHTQRLVKFEAVPNTQYDPTNNNHTAFVTFKSNLREFSTNNFFSIINMSLPDPLRLSDVKLPMIPPTQPFFIQDAGAVYGPFVYEMDNETRRALSEDGDLRHSNATGSLSCASLDVLGFRSAPLAHILKIDLDSLKHHLNNHKDSAFIERRDFAFMHLEKGLLSIPFDYECFLTVKDVTGTLSSMNGMKSSLSKNSLQFIRMYLSKNQLKLTPEVRTQLQSLLEQIPTDDSFKSEMVELIQNSAAGRAIIDEILDARQKEYVNRWDTIARKQHSELAAEIVTKEREIETANEKVAQASQQLTRLEMEIDRKTQQLQNEEYDGLIVQLTEKAEAEAEKKILKLKTEMEELERIHGKFSEYSRLVHACEEKQRAYDHIVMMHGDKMKILEQLQGQLRNAENELHNKIREIFPIVSAYVDPVESDVKTFPAFNSQTIHPIEIGSSTEASSLAAQIINTLSRTFHKQYGRTYSNAFIASILVAKQQSMISIFSGPPGVGKSSFVRLLRDITNQGDRFLEIRVGRNWSSERDLLGFYNPLNKHFSPATTGLYQYLKGIGEDAPETNSPHTILLDEANLSPIEHYGSSLLSMTDHEAELSFSLPHEKLAIPEDLRFIATINFDMTTEPLSPRLLDRSPVIPFDVFTEQDSQYSSDEINFAIPSQVFETIFGKRSILNNYESDALPDSLQTIINIMKEKDLEQGTPLIVSSRKVSRMLDYFITLREVLQAGAGESESQAGDTAADFTALYYLLPAINLHGEGGRKRLEIIASALSDNRLKMSYEKACDILARGANNLDSYNFLHY